MKCPPRYRGSSAVLPLLGKIVLIIGSDLPYEPDHPQLLAGFSDRYANEKAEVNIMDPARGHHGKFNQAMVKPGYRQETGWSDLQPVRAALKKGRVLNYQRIAS